MPILASSYSSSEGGLTLSNVLLGAATNTKSSRFVSEGDYHGATSDLPRREDALELAEHYFKHVYHRLPFFSTRGFWAQFELAFGSNFVLVNNAPASHQTDGRSRSSSHRHDTESAGLDLGYSCFTVLLVAAISLSTKPRSSDSLRSYQAQRFFNTALRYCESAIVPNTIVGVQSLLFLIQLAMVHPSILDAWYLIGVGMRCCIDLGLHQDPQSISSISPSLLETRRRLWWSMYSLDRSMSLGCGRPTEISDSVIGAGLPSFRIESSANEAQIQGYLQRYRALQLQSRIYDALGRPPPPTDGGSEVTSSTVSKLSEQLAAWNQANDPSYSQTLVESEWLMGRMLLYRPCPLLPERAIDEVTQLWEASLRFAALYRQLVEENSIYYVQVASEKIYWTGLAILHSAWRLCCSVEAGHEPDETGALSERRIRLWKGVQDVLFILGKLSTKWEDGELLARQFETASGAVIEHVHGGGTQRQGDLPSDVVEFYNYSSLTRLWSFNDNER